MLVRLTVRQLLQVLRAGLVRLCANANGVADNNAIARLAFRIRCLEATTVRLD